VRTSSPGCSAWTSLRTRSVHQGSSAPPAGLPPPPPPPPPPESLLASGALSDIVRNRFLQLKKLSSSAQAAVDTGAKRAGKCIGFVSLQAAQSPDDTDITSALLLASEIANIHAIFSYSFRHILCILQSQFQLLCHTQPSGPNYTAVTDSTIAMCRLLSERSSSHAFKRGFLAFIFLSTIFSPAEA